MTSLPLLDIKKVYRTWVEVHGSPIRAYAIADKVKITETEAHLTFKMDANCGELNAIALGKDYQVDYDCRSVEMLEAKPKSRHGRLKDSRGESDFQVVEEELSNAIAYYLTDSNEKTGEGSGLEIMSHRDDVVDDDQIAINSEGRIYVASNLKDKIVKVKTAVTYPRIVAVLPEDLKSIMAHFVCLWGDDSIKYCGAIGVVQRGGTVSLKNQLRAVRIDIEELRIENLAITP